MHLTSFRPIVDVGLNARLAITIRSVPNDCPNIGFIRYRQVQQDRVSADYFLRLVHADCSDYHDCEV